jgi:peptidylprolyl isomerase/peptidyl-prolyl cis-trans isomerase C
MDGIGDYTFKMKTYHVHHILVTHQYEAEDLLKKLKNGGEFFILAQKYSTCPSAAQGGDLGKIPVGKADPNFEEAAMDLKPGEITAKPVRTRFGYHIIKRIA